MRQDADHSRKDDKAQNDHRAQDLGLATCSYFGEHGCSPSTIGSKSQKTKESRSTTWPARTRTGERKMGPSKTKVWNSPYSPHGSTPAGKSSKKEASSWRPANDGSSFLGSMQTVTARKPSAMKRAAN